MERNRTIALPCACASLRRAARAATQLYDEELRATRLRTTQFTLLQVLERVPSLIQGELGAILALDSTTLTRTLAPLIKKGWIQATPGQDRRERHLRLTAAGKNKLWEAIPHWQRAQERFQMRLGPDRWGRLAELLPGAAEAAQG